MAMGGEFRGSTVYVEANRDSDGQVETIVGIAPDHEQPHDFLAEFLEKHGEMLMENHDGEMVTVQYAVENCPPFRKLVMAMGEGALLLVAVKHAPEEQPTEEATDEKNQLIDVDTPSVDETQGVEGVTPEPTAMSTKLALRSESSDVAKIQSMSVSSPGKEESVDKAQRETPPQIAQQSSATVIDHNPELMFVPDTLDSHEVTSENKTDTLSFGVAEEMPTTVVATYDEAPVLNISSVANESATSMSEIPHQLERSVATVPLQVSDEGHIPETTNSPHVVPDASIEQNMESFVAPNVTPAHVTMHAEPLEMTELKSDHTVTMAEQLVDIPPTATYQEQESETSLLAKEPVYLEDGFEMSLHYDGRDMEPETGEDGVTTDVMELPVDKQEVIVPILDKVATTVVALSEQDDTDASPENASPLQEQLYEEITQLLEEHKIPHTPSDIDHFARVLLQEESVASLKELIETQQLLIDEEDGTHEAKRQHRGVIPTLYKIEQTIERFIGKTALFASGRHRGLVQETIAA